MYRLYKNTFMIKRRTHLIWNHSYVVHMKTIKRVLLDFFSFHNHPASVLKALLCFALWLYIEQEPDTSQSSTWKQSTAAFWSWSDFSEGMKALLYTLTCVNTEGISSNLSSVVAISVNRVLSYTQWLHYFADPSNGTSLLTPISLD